MKNRALNFLLLLWTLVRGALVCAVIYFTYDYLDDWVIALLSTVIGAVTSTAVLDLGHCSDALGSVRPKEDRLRILKDKKFGAMGAISMALALIFRYILTYETIIGLPLEGLIPILAVAPLAGRLTMCMGAVISKPFSRREKRAMAYNFVDLIICALASFGIVYWLIGIRAAILTVLLQSSAGILLSVYASKPFGGTGDKLLGALCEIGTLFFIFITLIW